MPKVSLKSVGREIKSLQRTLKSGRAKASAEQRVELDDLIQKLDGLHAQAYDCCPKAMDGLAVQTAAKKKPAAKKRAAKPKRRKR